MQESHKRVNFHRDFYWSDELSTAITFLDEEHKNLIARYHEIVDELEREADLSRFLEGMARLGEDAQAHFNHEERVMRNIEYPAYADHKAAHDRLTADFRIFLMNIGVGFSEEDLPTLTEYFRYWFVSHIKEHDVKLKDYLDRPE